MKRITPLLATVFVLAACHTGKPDGAQLAQEVCDCKARVPKDEHGIAKDFKDLVACSAIKVKAMEKLKNDEAGMKKFQDKLADCGDWEFRKK
ncbi:MAG: hypothetical protein U0X40_02370 [Ferruginibacter sp.]